MHRFTVSIALILTVNISSASGPAVRVHLLGERTVLYKGFKEGVGYSDGVEGFLSELVKWRCEVINGGIEGATVSRGSNTKV